VGGKGRRVRKRVREREVDELAKEVVTEFEEGGFIITMVDDTAEIKLVKIFDKRRRLEYRIDVWPANPDLLCYLLLQRDISLPRLTLVRKP